MKTIPIGVSTGTLAFGIRVIRKDGEVFGWTEHNKDQTVPIDSSPGDVLLANPGFNIQSLVSAAGLGVDNTTIKVVAGEDITRGDILARVWDGAEVYFFRYDWTNPTAGVVPVKRGSFGNFKPNLGEFEVEFRDIRQALQPNSTWVFQETCRWRFGDARCGIDTSTYDLVSVPVSSVTSQSVFAATYLSAQLDDFYGEGFLTWTTGLNTGLEFKIKSFVQPASTITLSESAIYEIQVGDEFTIVAGCRKRWEEDCKTKFNNLLNFGGEKDKPTRDSMVVIPA